MLALVHSPALGFLAPSSSSPASTRSAHQTCPRPIPTATTTVSMAAAAAPVLEGYSGRKPKAPLPPIILSNVPGTWAYDTMSRRIRDDILARIYAGGWVGR